MNVGRVRRDHPRATITCNTVGLLGPMGTRWGVLSAEKRILLRSLDRLDSTPLSGRARPVAPCLVVSFFDVVDDPPETIIDFGARFTMRVIFIDA